MGFFKFFWSLLYCHNFYLNFCFLFNHLFYLFFFFFVLIFTLFLLMPKAKFSKNTFACLFPSLSLTYVLFSCLFFHLLLIKLTKIGLSKKVFNIIKECQIYLSNPNLSLTYAFSYVLLYFLPDSFLLFLYLIIFNLFLFHFLVHMFISFSHSLLISFHSSFFSFLFISLLSVFHHMKIFFLV